MQASSKAKILIAGQAPGKRVHQTGIPFDDPSGDRLREWMGVSHETFYNEKEIAILPMGFCYPGKGKSGDLPPRKECAEEWRKKLLERLQNVELTLVIGRYALKYHIPDAKGSLTDVVKTWGDFFPHVLPLPHPSPRNNIWLKRNAWFQTDVLPALRRRVSKVLAA